MGRGKTPELTDLSRGLVVALQIELARAGLHQTALAEQIGMPKSGMSRRMNGQLGFDLIEVERMAAVFGIPPHVLIERAEQEAKHLKPTLPDVLDLAADHTTQPLDRDRWEAENEHDDPA